MVIWPDVCFLQGTLAVRKVCAFEKCLKAKDSHSIRPPPPKKKSSILFIAPKHPEFCRWFFPLPKWRVVSLGIYRVTKKHVKKISGWTSLEVGIVHGDSFWEGKIHPYKTFFKALSTPGNFIYTDTQTQTLNVWFLLPTFCPLNYPNVGRYIIHCVLGKMLVWKNVSPASNMASLWGIDSWNMSGLCVEASRLDFFSATQQTSWGWYQQCHWCWKLHGPTLGMFWHFFGSFLSPKRWGSDLDGSWVPVGASVKNIGLRSI